MKYEIEEENKLNKLRTIDTKRERMLMSLAGMHNLLTLVGQPAQK